MFVKLLKREGFPARLLAYIYKLTWKSTKRCKFTGLQRLQPVSFKHSFSHLEKNEKNRDKQLQLNWWISRISEPPTTYYF